MGFPLQFVKSSGYFDSISPLFNLAVSGAVIGLSTATLFAISFVALKGLGFKIAAVSLTVIATTSAAIGVGVAIVAYIGIVLFANETQRSFSKI